MTAIGHTALRGTATIAIARFATRILNILAMLLIARLLGPSEMGVFAVASLVLIAVEQLTETGLRIALVQRSGPIETFLVPVYSFLVVRGIGLAAAIAISASWIADFFNSPQAATIISAIALIPLIRGAEPLTLTVAQRDLNFAPLLRITVAAAFCGLIAGVLVATYKPTAWAMVAMSVTTAAAQTVGALCVTPHAIRFANPLPSLRILHSFSKWVLVTSITSFVFLKAGEWFIGHGLGTRALAVFQMSMLICSALTTEFGGVLGQALFPALCKLDGDVDRIASGFKRVFALLSLITSALGALTWICADQIVSICLGPQWIETSELVPWITLWSACAILSACLGSLFLSLGRSKAWALTVLSMAIAFCSAAPFALHTFGLVGICALMAIISLLSLGARIHMAAILLRRTAWSQFGHCTHPLLAAAATITVHEIAVKGMLMGSPAASLLISAPVAIVVFSACLLLSPRLSRPTPLETLKDTVGLIRAYRRPSAGPSSTRTMIE